MRNLQKKVFCMAVLFTMMCTFLSGCGEKEDTKSAEATVESTENDDLENEDKIYSVGDTIETSAFTYTLNKLEFVDGIVCDDVNGDSFFTAGNQGVNVLTGGESGNTLLYFEYSMQFTGKSSLKTTFLSENFFVPSINYLDYAIDDNYFVFWKIPDEPWYGMSSDVDWNVQKNIGLGLGHLEYTFEPLEDKNYIVRGAMSVPTKAVEDTSSEMTISFDLLSSYDDGNLQMDSFTFKIR